MRSLAEEARKRETRLALAMIRALTPIEQELLRLAGNLMERLADAIEPDGTSPVKTKEEKT